MAVIALSFSVGGKSSVNSNPGASCRAPCDHVWRMTIIINIERTRCRCERCEGVVMESDQEMRRTKSIALAKYVVVAQQERAE